MSDSNRFPIPKPTTRVERNVMFDTVLSSGKISKFVRQAPIVTSPKGVVTRGPSEDRTMDLTAPYVVEGYAADLPALVRVSSEAVAVSGSTPAAITAPAFGHYAEVYIEDGHIRWTQDGSEPADNNGEQENAGGTIKLYGRDAVEGFRAVSIDATGNLAPTGLANLTVTVWNMNPETRSRYVIASSGAAEPAPEPAALELIVSKSGTALGHGFGNQVYLNDGVTLVDYTRVDIEVQSLSGADYNPAIHEARWYYEDDGPETATALAVGDTLSYEPASAPSRLIIRVFDVNTGAFPDPSLAVFVQVSHDYYG